MPDDDNPRVEPRTPLWRRLSRTTLVVLLVVVGLLAVIRLLLPWGLKYEINTRLSHIPGYTGHVNDVGVQVWHGGYRMYDLAITKSSGKVQLPFVAARRIQFSIAYRELLHGRIVSDIAMDEASLNFVRGPSPETSELEADKRWQDVITDLFPIKITHLKLNDSHIRFVDTTTKPKVDIAIDHLQVEADGLQNRSAQKGGPYPAHIDIVGDSIGNAKIHAFIQAEPLALEPHFKLNFTLKGLSLPALNDFLMAYANVDVGAGQFDAYIEATGANGSFEGYVKPFLKDLAFANGADKDKNAWQRVWKDVVAGVASLIKNKPHNQLATLIPFSGKFSHGASVDFWRTLGNLLHNGFIRGLYEGLEGSPQAKKPSPAPEAPAAPAPAHN